MLKNFRSIPEIDRDIIRCHEQIKANKFLQVGNTKTDKQIINDGFTEQLHRLETERDQALRSLTVVNPATVHYDGSEHLGI